MDLLFNSKRNRSSGTNLTRPGKLGLATRLSGPSNKKRTKPGKIKMKKAGPLMTRRPAHLNY